MTTPETKDAQHKRLHEKYQVKIMEFKEANKKTLCIYNLIATAITIACAVATLIILKTDDSHCSDVNLNWVLYAMFGMHIINSVEQVCGITGLDKICCMCLCTLIFFIYEVAVLLWMGIVYS